MVRMCLAVLAVGAMTLSFGCGCGVQRDKGADGKIKPNGKAAGDPNAAVKPSFWGEERVTFAAASKWMAGRPVPDGEQWPTAPTDVDYVRFTYCVSRTLHEYGGKRHHSTYMYNADGVTRTNRMELYGPDGALINVLSETESWKPETGTWEIETDGAAPLGPDEGLPSGP
jgi:hypothetical protein